MRICRAEDFGGACQSPDCDCPELRQSGLSLKDVRVSLLTVDGLVPLEGTDATEYVSPGWERAKITIPLQPRQDPGIERVREFHTAFDVPIPDRPYIPYLSPADRQLLEAHVVRLEQLAVHLKAQAAEANGLGRVNLATILVRLQLDVEETAELFRAVVNDDIVEVLDALTDKTYVTNGSYLTFGLGEVKVAADEEVHRSNMSKLDEDGKPIIHASGRVVKGPRYSPPDLARVLDDHAKGPGGGK